MDVRTMGAAGRRAMVSPVTESVSVRVRPRGRGSKMPASSMVRVALCGVRASLSTVRNLVPNRSTHTRPLSLRARVSGSQPAAETALRVGI